MDELAKKIKQLSYLADRYDPRYDGKERMKPDISDEECEERAAYMLRNHAIVIGGSGTRPLQAFVLRECKARPNASGRSVTVKVADLLVKFVTGYEWYAGTNIHNTIEFSDVYASCMSEQPWERKGTENG